MAKKLWTKIKLDDMKKQLHWMTLKSPFNKSMFDKPLLTKTISPSLNVGSFDFPSKTHGKWTT